MREREREREGGEREGGEREGGREREREGERGREREKERERKREREREREGDRERERERGGGSKNVLTPSQPFRLHQGETQFISSQVKCRSQFQTFRSLCLERFVEKMK